LKSQKQNIIELHSEEMNDILTRPPHILVRSGTVVICTIIFFVLTGSFFFKYPDIVTGEIVITTQNPPVWLVAKASGKIKELNYTDKSNVLENKIIAVIENPATTDDVLKIKSLLTQCLITDSSFHIPAELFCNKYELGDMQNLFSAFLKSRVDYTNFLSLNIIDKERQALNIQIEGHKKHTSILQRQLALKREELEIVRSSHLRNEKLLAIEAISKEAFEKSYGVILNYLQAIEQLEAEIAKENIETGQIEESLSKLSLQYQREKNDLLSDLNGSLGELESAILAWEQMYLLITPIKGIVTFNVFWTNNQYVNQGDRVFAVVPNNTGEIYGRARFSETMSGKIKNGQQVNIRVAGYPYIEYGTVIGRVSNVSLVAADNTYLVDVYLINRLITNTGISLNFTGELTGEAEIITDDRSIAERILAPLKYLIYNYMR